MQQLMEAIERLTAAVAQADADRAEAFADAENTGDRPDLHDSEVEVLTEDLRYAIASIAAAKQTKAAADVIAERRRQVEMEGFTPEYDDEYDNHSLAMAGASYAYFSAASDAQRASGKAPGLWQWSTKWWKPTNRRRDLVKAAALILAEIERLDRAEARAR